MTRLSLLLAGAATLIAVSAAEARDGCGRGWFFNGVSCAQQEARAAATDTAAAVTTAAAAISIPARPEHPTSPGTWFGPCAA